MTPLESLATFLHVIHPTDTGWCELRALPQVTRAFVPVGDVDAVAAFLNQHAAQNIYVGVATRRSAASGKLENCAELWALFVDLDFKTVAEAEARARLAAFPFAPSLIVYTGGGVHAYFGLKEPLLLPEEAARATSLLRRLAHALGGDLGAAEPARVLRVPGSWNYKPDYASVRAVALESPLC